MSVLKVAVIIPVFNEQDRIKIAINSVLNQTFKNWVLIIIDDSSKDMTSSVLDQYSSHPQVFILRNKENKGVAFCRNVGIALAQNLGVKYLTWLDSDDSFLEDKLEWQVRFMEKNKRVTLFSCAMAITADHKLLSIVQPFTRRKWLFFGQIDNYKLVPSASSIIRLEHIGNIRFNESYKYGSDQDFLRRLLICRKYVFSPKIGYIYNRGYSFSTAKYNKSLEFDWLAKRNAGVSSSLLKRELVINEMKKKVIFVLDKFNLLHLYFKKIGRKPTWNELTLIQNKIS